MTWLVAGLGKLNGRTIVLLGTQKGRDIKERALRNFGMASPEGYRKAMRAMEIAERHRFPVVTLIDTPGAYPGIAAEQRFEFVDAGDRLWVNHLSRVHIRHQQTVDGLTRLLAS